MLSERERQQTWTIRILFKIPVADSELRYARINAFEHWHVCVCVWWYYVIYLARYSIGAMIVTKTSFEYAQRCEYVIKKKQICRAYICGEFPFFCAWFFLNRNDKFAFNIWIDVESFIFGCLIHNIARFSRDFLFLFYRRSFVLPPLLHYFPIFSKNNIKYILPERTIKLQIKIKQ